MKFESAEAKLQEFVTSNAWLDPEITRRRVLAMASENSSVSVRRAKIIKIATEVGDALAPIVACRSGCSHCCTLNTVIYEHEAQLLARVTGREMKRLQYRPPQEVFETGNEFDRRPCPFLENDRCSVYEHRPLVCRVHHSLNESSDNCDPTKSTDSRVPMYDADIFEMPYITMNQAKQPLEPWGNILEFFPADS